MVDKDILLAKIGIIKRCLNRIKKVTELKPDNLDNFDKQDIFVLNLQRSIQAAIDIANHIISEENFGLSDSMRQSFEILYENKIIDYELLKKMKNMTAFRNISVHEYQDLNIDILKSILQKNLNDLVDFYKIIFNKFLK